MGRKKIGLALGGGSAKGIAHIGVVKALIELHVPVDCVAGTSAGSAVGAFVAAAVSPERMRAIVKQVRWRDVIHPVIPRVGLLDSRPMEHLLVELLGDRLIEDLALPYAAVAVDIESGREVVLTSGPLSSAVRASCSIPGFFTPVERDGRLLVDGGVRNNVPVTAARALGADFVIAVDLSGRVDPTPLRRNIFGIMLRSWEIMAHDKRTEEVAGADILIRPRVEKLGSVNLEAADAYIKAGYEAAMGQREALADLMERARHRPIVSYLDPRTWNLRARRGRRRGKRGGGGGNPRWERVARPSGG